MFYLFAVIFGFSYGGFIALESPLVADLFGLRSHGAILGMAAFGAAIGSAIGPLVVGRIFDVTVGYQIGFLVCAVLSVAVPILALYLRRTRREGLV